MHTDGRMQASRRLPGPEANTSNKFTSDTGRLERYCSLVTRYEVARVRHTGHSYLQALKRRIDIPDGAARCPLLPEHMPRFKGMANFNTDVTPSYLAITRKSKFKMRREPIFLKRVTVVLQIFYYF